MSHSVSGPVSAVGQLLLVRLLVPAKKKPTRGDLKKSLDVLFQHRHSAAEWSVLLDETLASLTGAGLIAQQPLSLTDAGQHAALDFLGLDALPPKTTWTTLKNKYLLARALQLPAVEGEERKRLATLDGLRAVILRKRYALATADVPKVTDALDALAWKQLDVADGGKFTRDAVLARCFGLEGKLTAAQVKGRLAAQAVDARNTRPDELRLTVLRRWLDATTPQAEPTPSAPLSSIAASVALSLVDFVQGTHDAARAAPTGRFGAHKVFISHVWRHVQQTNVFPGLTEPEFKERLIEANQAGLLSLSRADLVEAMSPEDVRESEVRYLNAAFHFLQV